MAVVLRATAWVVVLAALVTSVHWSGDARVLACAALGSTAWPLWLAFRVARGTALRAAVVWAAVAVALGMVCELAASFEPWREGRPLAGHLAYLWALASLAALITVLNARMPGGVAWAMLMALLVVVLLIPWLEGSGLDRGADAWSRLRLDPPWSLFYLVLAAVGVTNYLPTRYGPAALVLGIGLALEYLALTRLGWSQATRGALWTAAPGTLALAIWTADACARRPRRGQAGLERLWLWFRDHWGVVWALRVQDRFNRNASLAGWPVRLAWRGVVQAGDEVSPAHDPAEAEAALLGLLRRFADRARLEAELGREAT